MLGLWFDSMGLKFFSSLSDATCQGCDPFVMRENLSSQRKVGPGDPRGPLQPGVLRFFGKHSQTSSVEAL